MNRAVVLVLANLALAGCGKKSGPIEPPKDCTSEKDCADGQNTWCMKVGDASTGKCYPQPREGRPLAIEGELHVAAYLPGELTGDLAIMPAIIPDAEVERLRAAAQDEHASVAAFARTIAELMALGAPTWLLAETQIALGDEIRHTERTLDVLERRTGERPTLGLLPAAVAPLARSIEDFFRDVLVGGAIGETLAAAAAATRRQRATNAALRDLDEMIVVDESRHAALAFKTLRWLLDQRPALRTIVDDERARLDPLVAPLFEVAFA